MSRICFKRQDACQSSAAVHDQRRWACIYEVQYQNINIDILNINITSINIIVKHHTLQGAGVVLQFFSEILNSQIIHEILSKR